jgi:ribosomal protein S18 acetylase RimI-like enzyme
MNFRPARPDEAAALTDLAIRSKRSWGYDEAFMERVMPDMLVTPEDIAASFCLLAEDGGEYCGYVLLNIQKQTALLRDLFIDPSYFRLGIGRMLFERALAYARECKVTRLVLEADPNSQPFYERLGMRCTGRVASIAGNGRTLPVMGLNL